MPLVGFLATFDGSAARFLVPTEIAASACSLERLREVFFERTGLDAHVLHTGGLELGGQNEPFIIRLELTAPLKSPSTDYPPLRHARPWQEPGWFRSSLAWLEDALGETVQGLEQVSTNDLGTVLRIRTAARTAYFKTSEREHEAALTTHLAKAHPGLTPEVIAGDATRNLLLTEDGGPRLSETADPNLWQSAVTKLARFQQEAKRDALLDIGCPTHSFDDLAARAASFLQDDSTLGHWKLTPEQVASLLERLPLISGAHEQVRQLELPLLPTHGDAHPMNVLTGHDTSWFDWSDLCLAHPLLDIGWFLAWLSHPDRRGLPLRGHKQDATTILWQTYLEAAGHDGSTSLSDTMLITLTHRILVYHERYAYWQGTIPDWRPQYVPFLLRSLLKFPL